MLKSVDPISEVGQLELQSKYIYGLSRLIFHEAYIIFYFPSDCGNGLSYETL